MASARTLLDYALRTCRPEDLDLALAAGATFDRIELQSAAYREDAAPLLAHAVTLPAFENIVTDSDSVEFILQTVLERQSTALAQLFLERVTSRITLSPVCELGLIGAALHSKAPVEALHTVLPFVDPPTWQARSVTLKTPVTFERRSFPAALGRAGNEAILQSLSPFLPDSSTFAEGVALSACLARNQAMYDTFAPRITKPSFQLWDLVEPNIEALQLVRGVDPIWFERMLDIYCPETDVISREHRDWVRSQCLAFCISNDRPEMAKYHLEKGAKVAKRKDGTALLTSLAKEGKADAVRLYLQILAPDSASLTRAIDATRRADAKNRQVPSPFGETLAILESARANTRLNAAVTQSDAHEPQLGFDLEPPTAPVAARHARL